MAVTKLSQPYSCYLTIIFYFFPQLWSQQYWFKPDFAYTLGVNPDETV